MAKATARVASLLTTAETTTETTAVAAALGAVTGNMADTTALVTFLATSSNATKALAGGALRAFTRDVARSTAAVARLLLRSYRAFPAYGKKLS